MVERREANLQVGTDNDAIRIQREEIDGVTVEALFLNNEKEVDLEALDESSHENEDDFDNSTIEEEYIFEDECNEIEDDD